MWLLGVFCGSLLKEATKIYLQVFKNCQDNLWRKIIDSPSLLCLVLPLCVWIPKEDKVLIFISLMHHYKEVDASCLRLKWRVLKAKKTGKKRIQQNYCKYKRGKKRNRNILLIKQKLIILMWSREKINEANVKKNVFHLY